jgi:hypothetical protein
MIVLVPPNKMPREVGLLEIGEKGPLIDSSQSNVPWPKAADRVIKWREGGGETNAVFAVLRWRGVRRVKKTARAEATINSFLVRERV